MRLCLGAIMKKAIRWSSGWLLTGSFIALGKPLSDKQVNEKM
jgi:hypothetical protein